MYIIISEIKAKGDFHFSLKKNEEEFLTFHYFVFLPPREMSPLLAEYDKIIQGLQGQIKHYQVFSFP